MRHILSTILVLMLALTTLVLGWVGICNLGVVMPDGTDGIYTYDMAIVQEEVEPVSPLTQSPRTYAPFTSSGIPEEAKPLKEKDAQEAVSVGYQLAFASALAPLMSQLEAEAAMRSGAEQELSAAYYGESGLELLWQLTYVDGTRFRMAVSAEGGIQVLQLLPKVQTDLQLLPDDDLIVRAREACDALLAQCRKPDPDVQVLIEDGSLFYGLSDGVTFQPTLVLPQAGTEAEVIFERTSCRLEYPVEDGTVVMNYDYLLDMVSGYAHIADEAEQTGGETDG